MVRSADRALCVLLSAQAAEIDKQIAIREMPELRILL